MFRRFAGFVAAAALLVLTGCGGGRAPAPRVAAPAPPGGFQLVRFRAEGLTLMSPRDWNTVPAQSPQLALITSGGAVIALWHYPRSGPVPHSQHQLDGALRRLIGNARTRQPTLRLIDARVLSLAGHGALELQTIQNVGPTQRRVTSIHVFSPTQEVVLEEYAPQAAFPALERSVFGPVRHSLTVAGP